MLGAIETKPSYAANFRSGSTLSEGRGIYNFLQKKREAMVAPLCIFYLSD